MTAVRLRTIRWEAEGINSYELESPAGGNLPSFTAGGHIEVTLQDGLTRCYSLLNDPAERHRYVIAVHHAPDGRGGSRQVHQGWRPGDILQVSEPRNNFPLIEDAAHSVLIAGGIGITPMLSMVARLEALGRPWELHYVARTRARAAFLDPLSRHPQASLCFDEEPGGSPLDLAAIIAAAAPHAHLYCCGPANMLQAFEALAARRPAGHAHVEYFTATEAPSTAGGYRVVLQRSGLAVDVAPGQRMLDALLAAGANIAYSCGEGACGTCGTRVLDGTPDHRDDFLTDAEKASNASIMVCCSGSRSPVLVLDL